MVRKSNGRSIQVRSPRRARRHDARRDAILRAAARSFRDRGFAETGMRDIADAADLSPANLYHYFRGKDEILFYCQDRALDSMLAAARDARGMAGSAAERLRFVLTSHLRTMLDEVAGASAHLQVEALSPALRGRIVLKRDRYERALRRLIQDGVKAGELVADDPAVVTRAMLGALNWTVTWFRPDGPQPVDRVAETMAAFLVRGVANNGTRPAHVRRAALDGPPPRTW